MSVFPSHNVIPHPLFASLSLVITVNDSSFKEPSFATRKDQSRSSSNNAAASTASRVMAQQRGETIMVASPLSTISQQLALASLDDLFDNSPLLQLPTQDDICSNNIAESEVQIHRCYMYNGMALYHTIITGPVYVQSCSNALLSGGTVNNSNLNSNHVRGMLICVAVTGLDYAWKSSSLLHNLPDLLHDVPSVLYHLLGSVDDAVIGSPVTSDRQRPSLAGTGSNSSRSLKASEGKRSIGPSGSSLFCVTADARQKIRSMLTMLITDELLLHETILHGDTYYEDWMLLLLSRRNCVNFLSNTASSISASSSKKSSLGISSSSHATSSRKKLVKKSKLKMSKFIKSVKQNAKGSGAGGGSTPRSSNVGSTSLLEEHEEDDEQFLTQTSKNTTGGAPSCSQSMTNLAHEKALMLSIYERDTKLNSMIHTTALSLQRITGSADSTISKNKNPSSQYALGGVKTPSSSRRLATPSNDSSSIWSSSSRSNDFGNSNNNSSSTAVRFTSVQAPKLDGFDYCPPPPPFVNNIHGCLQSRGGGNNNSSNNNNNKNTAQHELQTYQVANNNNFMSANTAVASVDDMLDARTKHSNKNNILIAGPRSNRARSPMMKNLSRGTFDIRKKKSSKSASRYENINDNNGDGRTSKPKTHLTQSTSKTPQSITSISSKALVAMTPSAPASFSLQTLSISPTRKQKVGNQQQQTPQGMSSSSQHQESITAPPCKEQIAALEPSITMTSAAPKRNDDDVFNGFEMFGIYKGGKSGSDVSMYNNSELYTSPKINKPLVQQRQQDIDTFLPNIHKRMQQLDTKKEHHHQHLKLEQDAVVKIAKHGSNTNVDKSVGKSKISINISSGLRIDTSILLPPIIPNPIKNKLKAHKNDVFTPNTQRARKKEVQPLLLSSASSFGSTVVSLAAIPLQETTANNRSSLDTENEGATAAAVKIIEDPINVMSGWTASFDDVESSSELLMQHTQPQHELRLQHQSSRRQKQLEQQPQDLQPNNHHLQQQPPLAQKIKASPLPQSEPSLLVNKHSKTISSPNNNIIKKHNPKSKKHTTNNNADNGLHRKLSKNSHTKSESKGGDRTVSTDEIEEEDSEDEDEKEPQQDQGRQLRSQQQQDNDNAITIGSLSGNSNSRMTNTSRRNLQPKEQQQQPRQPNMLPQTNIQSKHPNHHHSQPQSQPTPRIMISIALTEEINCSYHQSKVKTLTVDGVVQVKLHPSSPINIPYKLIISDPIHQIKTIHENRKYIDQKQRLQQSIKDDQKQIKSEHSYVVTMPKAGQYMPLAKYRCNSKVQPVPIRVQSRVRIHGIYSRVALQISSNPSNTGKLTDLNIHMAVPRHVKGETVATSPVGGIWDGEERCVLWCVAELGNGEKFQLQAQFELVPSEILNPQSDAVTGTGKEGRPEDFPVLVRCNCEHSQLTTVGIRLEDAPGVPTDISMSLKKRFKLSHKEKP
mmetsp:Transcript_45841/g.53635  ORF Transcript_45841/g.53635 Transcript_45841/m.53635 type:complete len:1446 (-) Transcript_45841:74-4411(-)|eukprot:CAMPEP_0194447920 /NCGR_PEP_ID=MMETSP0176-20130528/129276_1 /TAXON_ID=216777 /ORGANISM="Proboscia alata, Strain PI-D3" /LENGTH=1445 /DNA_ID=CAMNT_0039274831 /DNA_START=465 /DNA_END=4802 /DNA_ORIENTATION=+